MLQKTHNNMIQNTGTVLNPHGYILSWNCTSYNAISQTIAWTLQVTSTNLNKWEGTLYINNVATQSFSGSNTYSGTVTLTKANNNYGILNLKVVASKPYSSFERIYEDRVLIGGEFEATVGTWGAYGQTASYGNTFTWTRTSFTEGNSPTTTISWSITAWGTTMSSDYTTINDLYINGVKVGDKNTRSGTYTIKHGADGSGSFTVKLADKSTTVIVAPLRYAATLTAAPNFNDEGNPTITYSNPSGSVVDDLEACIEWTGGAQTIKFRSISTTGTSYTFNLTDEERKKLRQGVTSGGSRSIRFHLRTQIGSTLHSSELTRTFTLVNHEPTLSPGIYDANSATTALTGNSNTIVRYASNVYYDAGASAHKEATLASISVTNGELTLSSGTGYIEGPASEKFSFEATDSRGFTVKQDLTATQWVPYVRFTTSLRVVSYTLDGNCTFGLSGNYYNGSFGAEDNRIYINMALFKNGQYYEEFKLDPFVQGTFTPNDANTAYDYQYTITGLTATEADGSYNTYTIQAEVRDKLSNYILTDMITASAVPVFDWSKNDFNFNVPVHFGRGFTSDVGLKTATNEPRVINIAAAGAHEIGTLSEMGIDYYDQRVYSITGTLYAESSGRTYPLPIPTLTLGVITTPAYSLAEAARLWIEDDTIYLTTGAAWGNVRVYLVLQYF